MLSAISAARLCINNFSACSERALDLPGYIPFVSSYSATIRLQLGIFQLITSLALSILVISLNHYKNLETSEFKSKIIVEFTESAIENLTTAVKNIVRAFFEFFPLVNLILVIYDKEKAQMDQDTLNTYPKISHPEWHLPILFSLSSPEDNLYTPSAPPLSA